MADAYRYPNRLTPAPEGTRSNLELVSPLFMLMLEAALSAAETIVGNAAGDAGGIATAGDGCGSDSDNGNGNDGMAWHAATLLEHGSGE